MPANVVKTSEQERLWNKAKKLAEKQGRAKDYAYIMGIFKQMGAMDKGAMPGIAKLGQDHVWEQAVQQARREGRNKDYDYIQKLYRKFTGWKSEAESSMQKSYLNPQQNPMRLRDPGQIPSREVMEAMKLAKEKPKPFSVARLLSHDESVPTTESIMSNLGLSVVEMNNWVKFLDDSFSNAGNELVLRQDIMSKCLNENMNSGLRRAILQRSLNHWRHYRKSMVRVMKSDELLEKAETRGGNYHRRVPKSGGGYRYFYDEDKYRSSKDAHTSGEEGTESYISGRVQKCIEAGGKGGCGVDAFQDLVKKYGAKAVAKVLKKNTGSKYSFSKGKFKALVQKETDGPGKLFDKEGLKEAAKRAKSKSTEKLKKGLVLFIPESDDLEKAGPHKYKSRKRDAKGNWVYEYADDKKNRIIKMILEWLESPKNKLTVASTARAFRIDKATALHTLRTLESKGKIRSTKTAVGVIYEKIQPIKNVKGAVTVEPTTEKPKYTREQSVQIARDLGKKAFEDGAARTPYTDTELSALIDAVQGSKAVGDKSRELVQKEYLAAYDAASSKAAFEEIEEEEPAPLEEIKEEPKFVIPKDTKGKQLSLFDQVAPTAAEEVEATDHVADTEEEVEAVTDTDTDMDTSSISPEEYEERMTELANQIGLPVGTERVAHRPGGGARTFDEFNINTSPKALRDAFASMPDQEKVDALVHGVSEYVGANSDFSAVIVRDDIASAVGRSAATVAKLYQTISVALDEVRGVHKDSARGDIKALEFLATYFGNISGGIPTPVVDESEAAPEAPEPKPEVATEFTTTTVEDNKSEKQIEEEENAESIAIGAITGQRVKLLKERGLQIVSKKRTGDKTDAEWEAIGAISGGYFKRLTDYGLTVEWTPGALPKAEPPEGEAKIVTTETPDNTPKKKSKRKPKQTSQDRLEQTGDHIWGNRKDLARLGQITDSKQLEGMSYDDAAFIVRKSRLIPVHDLDTLKAMGMSPGTAYLSLALLASIKAKPGDSAAERAAYVDHVREVTGGIQKVKTVDEFNGMLNDFSLSRRAAPQWETIETVGDREEAWARIAELEKDNPGINYGTRYSYSTYTTEIAKKVARPYDTFGPRFTKFIERSGKFHDAAHREALTADNLWSYNKGEDIVDGWKYLEEVDQKKKDATKKKAEKKKTTRGKTKRGWSGAKEVAKEIERVGGNIEIQEANAERTKDTFNFREVDYGDWLNQADREYHTKALEEAMHDFSEILGITPNKLSFKGRLGIALGARGRGKGLAHYEPVKMAINITKFKGGGSVAHEWGHAMDNIIAGHYIKSNTGSSQGDAYLTTLPEHSSLPKEIQSSIQGVLKAMNKHPDPEKATRDHKAYLKVLRGKVDSLITENNGLVDEFKKLQSKPKDKETSDIRISNLKSRITFWQEHIDTEKPKIDARKAKGQRVSVDKELEISHREYWIKDAKRKIADLKKPDAVRSAEDETRMEKIEVEIEDIRLPINRARTKFKEYAKMDPTASDYYKSGQILGKRYWGSEKEMFARAFESYVQDELTAKNRANTYLVDGTIRTYDTDAPEEITFSVQPYPQGDERKSINEALKKLMSTIAETKALEKSLQKFYIKLG